MRDFGVADVTLEVAAVLDLSSSCLFHRHSMLQRTNQIWARWYSDRKISSIIDWNHYKRIKENNVDQKIVMETACEYDWIFFQRNSIIYKNRREEGNRQYRDRWILLSCQHREWRGLNVSKDTGQRLVSSSFSTSLFLFLMFSLTFVIKSEMCSKLFTQAFISKVWSRWVKRPRRDQKTWYNLFLP